MSTSQSVSQIRESPWTTLQLTRFSHATNENQNAAHVNWIHIPQRDDLVLVLDFSQVKGTDGQWEDSKVLKVLRGVEMMERIDLKALVRVAVVEEARICELKLPISESRVSTLIRSPCVAVRYVTADSKVRRFQLRFPSHQVFEAAVSILKSIGLPLHHALPSNPPSAGTGSVRPDSSSQSRPTSTAQEQLISSQETLAVAKSPELPPHRNEDQGPNRVASLSSLLPSPAFPRDSSLSEGRSAFDFDMPPPDNRHRSAGTTSSVTAQGSSRQGQEALPMPATTPAFMPQMPDSISQMLPPRRILPFDPPTTRSRSKTPAVSASIESPQSQDAPSVSEPPATKNPSTRAKKQPAKPKAGPKAKPKAAPKPTPKPKPAKASTAKKGKTADEATQTHLETRRAEILDSQAEDDQMVDAPIATAASQAVESTAPAPSSEVGPVEASVTGRKRLSAEMEAGQDNGQGPPPTACPACREPHPRPNSHGGQSKGKTPVPHANPTPSPAPTAPAVEDVSPAQLNLTEGVVPPDSPTQPPPGAINSLAAYAAQSDSDRHAAIDTFLVQNVMDDDFLKLCEDVERSWRRIGLGPSHAAGGSGLSRRIPQISRAADAAALFENLCRD